MGKNFHNGIFNPKNPKKYQGNTPIFWRSTWELKVMHWFDEDPSVLRWASESVAIRYFNPLKNKEARYFPDFIADIKDKSGKIIRYLIEVKPSKEVNPPIIKPRMRTATKMYAEATYAVNREKWKAAEQFCKINGMTFKILTEKEVFNR